MALIFDRVELTDRIQLGNTNFQTNGTWTRHQTAHGYIDFGPANSSHAHIYTDRSNFYFDKQIQLLGGTLINQNDIQSNIFYDRNNTAYYVDPNGTSNLNALNVGGSPVLTAASGGVFVDGDLTLNMSNDDGLVYDDSNNTMYVKADGSNYAIIDSRGGTISGVLTMNGGGQKIALNNGDITGVNQITINDPGEGIVWTSGSSGNITLATIDDSSDNILNVSGTGATLAVNGVTVLTASTGITNSGNDTRTGNLLMYSTDTSGNYGQAAIELKEVNQVGTAQSAYQYAPAIAWHWGGRKQMQMRLHSDGHLYVDGSNYGQSKVWTAGSDGPGSGLDADLLDGFQLDSSSNTGSRASVIPYIKSDSVMEIGKYLDFHDTGSTADYDIRLSSSSGRLNVDGGYFQVNGSQSARASLFYDTDNTSYFINPASGNTNTALRINGQIYREGFDATSNGANNYIIKAQDYSSWIYATGGSFNWGLFWAGNDNAAYTYFSSTNPNEIAFVGGGSLRASIDLDNGQSYFGTSVRSPQFYDSNNTGYYIHGDGTSRLNIVNANAVGTSVAGIGKVMFPYGAEYNSGSTTGAIKITLPQSWTNTMMTMKITIYDYSINESFEVHCGGYNHTGGNGYWVNTHAKIIANGDVDRNFNVRFGHDGSKCCITIGETTSPWAYPKVVVTEWVGGHSNETFSNWDNGWDISIVTTLPSQIDQVRSNNQVGRYQSIVYDANNTNYYTDPDSTSNLNAVNANTISISGNSNLGNGNGDVTRVNDILHVGASDSGNASIIFGEDSSNWYGAHLYWDSGYRFSWKTRNAGTDTDLFYYDTNDLSYIHWNRHHHLHNKALHYVSELHFQDNVRFYDNGDDSYLNFKYGDADFGGIRFYNGGTTLKGSVYASNNGFGLLDSDGSWAVRTQTGTNPLQLRCDNNVEFEVYNSYTLSPGSSRAPIFYDSDNTGYYLNPASTSNLNAVTANSFSGNGSGVTNVDADTVDGYHGSRFFRRQHKANATVGSGWMTVASCGSGRHSGEVIVTDADSGDHAYIRIHWMRSYADSNFTVVNTGGHGNRITGARVLYQTSDNTYGTKLLQVYVTANSNYEVNIYELGDIADFGVPSVVTPVIENSKTGYATHGNELNNLDTYGFATEEGIRVGSHLAVGGTISNGSIWINDGTNYNGYDENIRLFNPANGVSVIAFAASGTSGEPTSSILGYSDRHEVRRGSNWETRTYNGYQQARGSYRAPIFYDSDDTNSYFDKSRLILRSTDPTIIFRDTDHTSAMWHVNSHRMYLLRGNGDTTSWSQVSGQWPVYWDLGNNNAYFGGTVVATNAFTAPIFYDSDNTSYYLNPASTSTINAVVFHGDFYHDTNNRDNGMFGSYDSTKTDHIWSMGTAYRNASNGANFGNLYGLAYKHTNNGTGGTMGGGHQMVWCNNGTPRGSIGYDRVWHTGDMQAGGNMYANAFYDDDNTNYYVNPATTSNLVGVTLTGTTNIGYTNLYHSGTYGTSMNIEFTGSSASGLYIKNNRGSTADGIMFAYSNAPQPPRGTISISSTGVSYNSVSDYRAKENVTPLTGAIDRVSLLKPSRFNFIGDGETVDGFLAHEVQEVVPQAVNGDKDAVDEDGNDLYQSMDNSKMVPLLTAALQEAIAKIESLEARIQVLENQ